jgi:hypothetical protein
VEQRVRRRECQRLLIGWFDEDAVLELRATMVHLLNNIWQWRITLQGSYNEPLADEAAAVPTTHGQSPGDYDFTMFLNERASGKS